MNCFVLFCIVHGNWSDWSPFGTCSKTCGGGTKNRLRTCTNPAPQHGGTDCKGSPIESMECNTHTCPSKLAVLVIKKSSFTKARLRYFITTVYNVKNLENSFNVLTYANKPLTNPYTFNCLSLDSHSYHSFVTPVNTPGAN